MKTIQIGDGKVKTLQFETLKEIVEFFSEDEIVKKFNYAYKAGITNALIVKHAEERRKKEVKLFNFGSE